MSRFIYGTILATAGTMAWTALTGGEIRHTEIRADTGPLGIIGLQALPQP